MFKLTELKKAIKSNTTCNMFFVDGFKTTLFNYKGKIIISLKGVDLKNIYEFLKVNKMCNEEFIIDRFYHNNELINTFAQLETSSNCNNDKKMLLDTNITFKKGDISYKVFKCEYGLYKVDINFINFLNLEDTLFRVGITDSNIIGVDVINYQANIYMGTVLMEKFDTKELLPLLEY